MRNLVPLQRRVWTAEASRASDDRCVASASIPGDTQVFFLHSSGRIESLHLDDHDACKDLQLRLELRECGAHGGASAGDWQWMSYVAELGALVCASTRGALVSVDVNAMIGEEVGRVDSGLRAVAWSDNQEVLALVTGANSLLVMSNDWEVLYETAIHDSLPRELTLCSDETSRSCAMCWRRDGMFLALTIATIRTDATIQTSVVYKVLVFTKLLELHAIGRLEDGRAVAQLGSVLDWSQHLALLASYEVRNGQFVVVFFECNGLRHGEFPLPVTYGSRQYQIASVRWNHASDILAVTFQSRDRNDKQVVMQLWSRTNYHWYLKQELRFRDRFIAIAWDEDVAGRLNVLTQSSYPQTLILYTYEFAWDISSVEGKLAVLHLDEASTQRKDCGVAQLHQSVAVTGVIDGSTLQLTPLHRTVVPPPFGRLQVTFDAAINSVVFDYQANVLLALLATGDVIMVENYLFTDARACPASLPAPLNDVAQSGCPDVLLKTTIKLARTKSDESCTLSCLLWVNFDAASRQLVFAGKTGVRDQLVLCSANSLGSKMDIAVTVSLIELFDVRRACLIQHLLSKEDDRKGNSVRLAVQTHGGTMYALDAVAEGELVLTRGRTNLTPYSHMTVLDGHIPSGPGKEADDGLVVIGLDESSARLYINDKVLVSACSSFRYSALPCMLFFTTQGRESQLCVAPLSGLQEFAFEAVASVYYEARCIERGALIVATPNQQSSVIVQMPRGNLECIFPRVLVVALAVQQIQAQEYVAALETCRRHRVDLNLLVDLNPIGFLTSFSHFLVHSYLSTRPAAVTSDRLCLFITNLHPGDVWATKYGPLLEPFYVATDDNHQKDAAGDGKLKVNVICQAFLPVIQELARDGEEAEAALLLPFVTAAVKQSPPDFDQALGKIQQLIQQTDGTDERIVARHRAAATRAIKHLIMLTNVDTLYAQAMSLYDLDLVRTVAMHSQRDPKDYGPFLDRVASLSNDHWRKYTIDVHLGRHARALAHVATLIGETDAHDQEETIKLQALALDLIQQGNLYDEALKFFPLAPQRQVSLPTDRAFCRQILKLKGDFLDATKQYEAAAYVYLSALEKEKARGAFIAARNWQMALALGARDHQSTDNLRNEAYKLAQELLNHPQHQPDKALDDILAVATIYVEYCHDMDEAVALLVTHQQWSEALRLAYLHQRKDLVESDIEPGVIQHCDDVMEELERKETQYTKHFHRLTTIRKQKRLFQLHGIDGTRWAEGDTDARSSRSVASSAVDSARSYASINSVGSHNSAASIGNFSLQSLSMATGSHFYATQTLGAASKTPTISAKHACRRERRKRMKEGSAEEEVYVEQQLVELQPNAALAREVRGLLEMLIFFGHVHQAQKLQSRFARYEQCVAQFRLPEFLSLPGQGATACDVQRLQWRSEALHD